MATFDVASALKAGYNQDQINSYIQQNKLTPINVSTPTPTPQATPAVAPQPTQQPDLASQLGSGALGILGNILKGITQPLVEAGNKTNQENAQLPNSKGNLGQSILNGILAGGNLAKNTVLNPKFDANAASYAIPFGKGANILTKVLGPGAAVGALQGASQDNATPSSVVGNTLLGAGGAGLLGGGASILGKILGGASSGLDNVGNSIIKSQYNVPAKVADKNALGDTLRTLSDYGFSNINDVAKVAPQVTGQDGVLTQLTRKAISQSSPVSTSGISDTVKGLLDNEPLITRQVAQKVKDIVSKGITSSTGDNIVAGDPLKTFDFVQQLESKASELGRGNDEAQALARVYKGVSSKLKDSIFNGTETTTPASEQYVLNRETGGLEKVTTPAQTINTGANSVLTNGLITPDVLNQIKQISPKLAEDVSSAKSLKELRSLAAPFVRGSKLAEETMSRDNNSLITGKNLGAGAVGGLIGGGPGALVGAAADKVLESNAGKSTLGNILKAGGKSIGATGAVNSPALQNILGVGGALTGSSSRSITGPQVNQGNNSNNTDNTYQVHNGDNIPQTGNAMQISPQQVVRAHMMLPPALAASVDAAYKAQFGGLQPADVQAQQGLVKETQHISDMIDKLNPDQGKVAISNLLGMAGHGDTGIQQLQAESTSLNQDLATTLHRRGMSPEQMKSMEGLFIQPGKDSVQVMKSKITAINNLLQNFYPYSTGADVSGGTGGGY